MFVLARTCSLQVLNDNADEAVEHRGTAPTADVEHSAEDEDSHGWRVGGDGQVELDGWVPSGSSRTFAIPKVLYDQLHAYQRAGTSWMARLHQAGHGGILADEMGLGKTVQVCSLLAGLRHAGLKHVLVLLPTTLMDQWAKEAKRWCPDWPVYIFHGSASQRNRSLERIAQPLGGLLLTSYAVFTNNEDQLAQVATLRPSLDEDRDGKGSKKRTHAGTDVLRQDFSAQLRVGARVQLTELTGAQELNGCVGTLRSFNISAGRWAVKLMSGELKNVRPENLVLRPKRREAIMAGESVQAEVRPWDLVICDEAHKMKNISTLLGRSIRTLCARCRILLTGTPVQNSLQDLWALMDFAQPGLLGNHATFVKRFSDPINQGSVRGASTYAVGLKRHLSEQLWKLVKPHLLRRTKVSVGLLAQDEEQELSHAPVPQEVSGGPSEVAADAASFDKGTLPPKRETVVWLLPTNEQTDIYRKILEDSDIVREAASKAKLGLDVFRAVGLLKRLCNHPVLALPDSEPNEWARLVNALGGSMRVAKQSPAGSSSGAPEQKPLVPEAALSGEGEAPDRGGARVGREVEEQLRRLPRSAEALLAQSAKLRCIAALLPALIAKGHRTLIFSQGVRMLDLLELCVLRRLGVEFSRIDGQTDVAVRAERVAAFQAPDSRVTCMLLTTGVGGFGLNLTGADRVIMLDPAWNPATDAQAVDRAFRIGQRREVRVYRLVMSGLVEDKMFRLQVFKLGLTKSALEATGNQQKQYFSSREIRGLFDWTDPAEGETRKLLLGPGDNEDSSVTRRADEDGASEGWLKAGPVVGLSNFSALFGPLSQNDNQEGDRCSAHFDKVKSKLDEADERVRQTQENRERAERGLAETTKAYEDATQGAITAAMSQSKATHDLKDQSCELNRIARLESASSSRVARLATASEAAQGALAHAKTKYESSQKSAGEAVQKRDKSHVQLLSTNAARQESLTKVERVLAQLSGGLVDAAPLGLSVTRSALEELNKALQRAEESRVRFEKTVSQCRRVCTGQGEGQESSTQEGAPPALRRSGLGSWERAPASTQVVGGKFQMALAALAEARDAATADRRGAAQLAATFLDSALAFTQSFCKAKGRRVTADQVAAVQVEAAESFRQLRSACDASSTALEVWIAAADEHRSKSQECETSAQALEKATLEHERTLAEHKEAAAEAQTRRAKRVAREAEVVATEAVCGAADANEVELKRRRDEMKGLLGPRYLELLQAKAEERRASDVRAAIHASCSELEGKRYQAEAERTSAVEALRGERYDARQVEEAYLAKKRQRF